MANMQRPPRKPRMLTASRPPDVLHGFSLEITNRCPLDCIQCSRAAVMDRKPADMDPKRALRLASSALASGMTSKDTWVSFGLAGEPLVNARVADIVDIILGLGFRRVKIYSSLMTSTRLFSRFEHEMKRGDLDGVYLHASAHFKQAAGRRFYREVFYNRWKRLRRAMGDRLTVGSCAPETVLIDKTRNEIASKLGLSAPDVRVDLPCDIFSMHGLAPRCECRPGSRCLADGMYITVEGDCALCCHDLKPTVVLGSVLTDGFRETYIRKLRLFDRMWMKGDYPEHCRRCASFGSLKTQVKGGWV